MPKIESLRDLIACRLCWKIALAVFSLILAVESLLLVPSYQRFERDTLRQFANEAIIAIEPTLAASSYGARRKLLTEGLAKSLGKYRIFGAIVADGSEILTAAGSTAGLESQLEVALPMGEGARRSGDGAFLDVAWPSAEGLKVAVRVDTSQVAGEVLAFVLRIAGLVAVIVLVVTAGTMLVLHRLVLRPVLRLRESSLAAGADPDAADNHVVARGPRDEIGELIEAHNALLGRVAASKRRDREIAEERARFQSHHEPLTGLPNRAALLEHLRQLRPGRVDTANAVSLFLVNLLQFRVLNASFGSAQCDGLLRNFAARLKQAFGPGDFVTHFGADRFAVVHVNGDFAPARAAEFAERILAGISEGYDLGGATAVSLAVRMGIANAAADNIDGTTLVNEAEFALARTRVEDGARYEFYSPAFGEEAKSRQALVRDLERGIAAGEMFVVLQPKIALLDEGGVRLSGAEVLVRWRHPARGLVSPVDFIQLAESTGLIVALGERVLADACSLVRDWLDRHGWAPRLAVNLSARQFSLRDLDLHLEEALALARISPDYIEIEVTESAAMKDVQRTADTLARLRSLGVKVSIDDFGTGYSSLAYLKRFSPDAIKIDKSFIDDIGSDRNSEAICDAILRLGQALGCRVVAEGVENAAQVAFLRRRRCDEAQGYFFGRPVPADEFEEKWIVAHPRFEAVIAGDEFAASRSRAAREEA